MRKPKPCDIILPTYVKTVSQIKDFEPDFEAKRSMLRSGIGLKRNEKVIGPRPKRLIEDQEPTNVLPWRNV